MKPPFSLLAIPLALTCSMQVRASISFNVTYTSTVQALSAYNQSGDNIQTAVQYVENEYSAAFSDPMTVDITMDTSTGGLGGSNTYLAFTPYSTIVSALTADATTADDASFVASLPGSDPIGGTHNWGVTCAEAKALNISTGCGPSDGTYTFNDTLSYTFDPNNRAVPGDFDFIGVTEHEFSEVMGRISTLGENVGGSPLYMLNDLDRFTTPGVRSFANCKTTTTSGIYLSPDGATNLAGFNNNSGGDCSDLDGTVATDPYNAFTDANQAHSLSSADMQWMDIIGYDLAASPTPEPGTFGLVGGLLIGAGLLRRRATRRK